MIVHEHNYQNNDIGIFKIDRKNGILIGTFYTSKPSAGDIITAHQTVMYVEEILENKDSKINNENCKKDPTNAWFKLRVRAASEEERFQAQQVQKI